MKNKILLIMLFCIQGMYVTAQINVDTEPVCLNRNSLILTKAMINFAGRDTVSQALDSMSVIIFYLQLDSSGYVKKPYREGYRIRNSKVLTDIFLKRFIAYLITNKIQFLICYDNNPPEDLLKIKARLREHFKKGGWSYLGIGFPGYTLISYKSAQKEAEKEGRTLSRLQYIEKQIQEELPQE